MCIKVWVSRVQSVGFIGFTGLMGLGFWAIRVRGSQSPKKSLLGSLIGAFKSSRELPPLPHPYLLEKRVAFIIIKGLLGNRIL